MQIVCPLKLVCEHGSPWDKGIGSPHTAVCIATSDTDASRKNVAITER